MKYKVKINGRVVEVSKGDEIRALNEMELKSIDKENHRLTMVASTQDVDRHGDTVVQAGWDLKHFKKNPVILNNHNYNDATEVIARAENIRIEGKGKRAKLMMDWIFAVEENPKAKIIFELYAGKFLHASSVGFIPRKFAEDKDGNRDWWTIEEAELLEVSAVSVPANAMALAKAKGIAVDELPEEMIEEEPEANEVIEPEEDTEADDVEDDETEEEPEPEETVEEKRARLKKELKDLGDDDDGDDSMIHEDGDFEDEPELTQKPKKLSYNAKVLNAIHTISKQERRAYETAGAIINSLLDEDPNGAKLDREIRAKVRKRKVNKAIRILIKSK